MGQFAKYNNDALKRIYKWYYGSWPSDANPDWDDLNDILNRMMVETVQCSERVGWIEDLWKSTVIPPSSVASLLKSVGKKWAKRWARMQVSEVKVYEMCKKTAARNYKSVAHMAVRAGSMR